MYKIGIDVGGTFTDFVVAAEGDQPRFFKTQSTPEDPSIGVMTGLQEAAAAYGLSLDQFLGETDLVIHGSTVATNTLVERKGAKVGLVTTDGFRDLLEMREGLKEDRYNLRMTPAEPLSARYLRVGIPERVRASGKVERPLDESALIESLEYLVSEGAESLAVCFLFSYLNPSHEQQAAEVIRRRFPDMYASLSHEVIPQIKEFDRLSTTVINSYVGPVFSRYLSHLGERFEAYPHLKDVLIMQSNGGVAPIADSSGMAVRAILSGPAGGVSAAAYIGQLLEETQAGGSARGFNKLIAFDMGGTSTDISLIENGVPHITNEKFEAGWKIAAPMIDIHTLGAGGGSIARVDDGGILHVGPESAGADPGPACYGRGGIHPTVTDASLVLGYLDASNFLGGRASLDPLAADRALALDVATPLNLSNVESACGVYKVVCTTIAEGIRLMSVQRGVDPRDFTIMGFGGASGLHASEVARQLQVAKVYIPASAPVLSAYGMLSTDIKYDFFRSYPVSLDRIDLDALRAILDELDAQGRDKFSAQGVADEAVEIQYSADMRYLDQIYEVTVPLPDPDLPDAEFIDRLTSNFHRRYQELYSYNQQDQEVRLVTLRTAAVGKLPRIAQLDRTADEGAATPAGTRRVYMGEWRDAPTWAADSLPAGTEIAGPAVLESEFTTILVWPGDHARVDSMGGVELQVNLEEAPAALDAAPVSTNANGRDHSAHEDPITLAVVEHRLESIAQEMTEAMLRTAMSQILNSSRDFSTAILDRDCQLVAQGEGIPVHISALPVAGAAVRDYFGDDIHDGDLFILNDPYFGGSHLPDITIIRPVFHDGRVLFYGVNRAHHSDVGGGTHGGYNPGANEIYQEGLRIPPLKLYDRGVPRNDLLQMLSANVRQPENFLGDLNAQIGSVMLAAQRIGSLLADYGPDRLMAVVSEILAATERQVRQFIAGWPDGVYKGESFVDDDGFDSKLVPIRAEVTIAGDSMTIDLSESSPQVEGFINSAYANTRSLAHAAIMYLAPMDVARNEGSMRPVQIVAPRGLVVNANPPAPVCMSTNHCAEEVVEAVFKALAPAIPAAVSAGFSRRLRYAITGFDPRSGRQFIWHFFLARGGGGASEGYDGWSNVGEVNVAGGIRSPSIEVTEERFPFFIERHELRPDSGGVGAWRGGLGAVCDLVYEGEGPALLNTAGDGIVVPPFGLFGATDGLPHHYTIVSNGSERVLGSKEVGVVVNPGDHIICLSSGGGGYGQPKDRDGDAATWDLKNGYVTR